MRIAVFGAGGVGGYLGAHLARAGASMAFIARGEQLAALRKEGLRLEGEAGEITVRDAQFTDRPSEVGAVDYVLLCVKTWQVEDAVERLRPMIGPGTAVVPFQNGVDSPRLVADRLGTEHVLPGMVRVLSKVEAPGRIRHLGGPSSVTFAEWSNQPSPRVDRLREAFLSAGIAVDRPADVHAALWEKLLLIGPVGIVAALARAPMGVVRAVPETRRVLEAAMTEVFEVAGAVGAPLSTDVVARTLSFVDTLPPAGTSSLQRDVAGGRPSELEAVAGAVVRHARAAGVGVPVHEMAYGCLLPLERRARGEMPFPE